MKLAHYLLAIVMVGGVVLGFTLDNALGIKSTGLNLWVHDTYIFLFGVVATLYAVRAFRWK